MPNTPDISPLSRFPPDMEPIMVRANRQMAKYSWGPNLSATCAREGAMKIRARIDSTVPQKE